MPTEKTYLDLIISIYKAKYILLLIFAYLDEENEMTRKTVLVLIIMLVLTLTTAPVVQAASIPVAGCPTGFMLMSVMQHDAMEHIHVGLAVDLNGDGYLCMRAATSTIHVHMDNVVVVQ
jgi:hypothetical protein